jgi:hypothetical protein
MLQRRQLCLAATLAVAGCASEPRQPATRVMVVPERVWEGETPELADRVSARVLIASNAGSVGQLELRHWRQGLKTHPAMRGAQADLRGRLPPIWELSNPDARGSFAALVTDEGERRHAVRLLQASGPQRVLRQQTGDALWDRAVSGMALSPDGRYLAMVVQADPVARYRPLHLGRLVVLDLAAPPGADGFPTERPLPPGSDGFALVLGQRPAWINGGRQLLVAAPGPQGRAASANPVAPAMQPDPHIEVIDWERQTRMVLTPGHSPIASGQGPGFLLARGGTFTWWVTAGAGQGARAVPRLHGLGTPVALIDQRYLLYTGAPHPQAPRELTSNNSPLVGPKAMLALKVMDLQTQAVLSLLEGIDPRRRVAAAPMPA